MIGDGVIAESVISFEITWKNPGNGEQPKWDQNDQKIYYHQADIYPDLVFTKAQGIATYYTYTTIDSIIHLLKEIDAIIDEKLESAEVSEEVKQLGPATSIQRVGPTGLQTVPRGEIQKVGSTALQRVLPGNTQLQTVQKGQVPATVQRGQVPATVQRGQVPATVQKGQVPAVIQKQSISSDPEQPVKPDEVTSEPEPKQGQEASGSSRAYTVIVYGKELKFIDAQLTSANIRVRHRISANLFRKINEEIVDNTKNIWLEVHFGLGRMVKMEMKEFETEDGKNLLVQVLPTIDIVLTPDKNAVTPKSEETINVEDRIRNLKRLRYEREENRFDRSRTETEKGIKQAGSYWKKSK